MVAMGEGMPNISGAAARLPLNGFAADFAGSRTVASVMDSLGSVSGGTMLKPIAVSDGISAGNVEIELSDNGASFFREMLNLKLIDPRVRLLTMKKAGSYADPPLPFGIMFKGTTWPRYLDYMEAEDVYIFNWGAMLPETHGQVELVQRAGYSICPGIFPENRNRIRWMNITPRPTSRHDVEAEKEMQLNLLALDLDGIQNYAFSHQDAYSTDFQTVILHHGELMKGKKVTVVGSGTGVDTIIARKLGASSVWATDVSQVYTLLTRWNCEYATETGQMAAPTEGELRSFRGPGFMNAPRSDGYLFNAPSIREREEMVADLAMAESTVRLSSIAMSECHFEEIFVDLADRLKEADSFAIWRILPYMRIDYPTRIFAVSEDEARKEIDENPRVRSTSIISSARARSLFKYFGLQAEYAPNTSGIYVIRKN